MRTVLTPFERKENQNRFWRNWRGKNKEKRNLYAKEWARRKAAGLPTKGVIFINPVAIDSDELKGIDQITLPEWLKK
jgi:hypothetical protein